MSRISALPELDVASYQRSVLHADSSIWLEKNCYIDIWIEVIHALKLNPIPMLPVTLAIDFEGDQWTFFKPSHGELYELYGVDVQELNVWRPLVEHAVEYLSAGKLISTEADAFWLPDTSGTDYRRQHVKTTIVLADIDMSRRTLNYFHNAGYHSMQGEDFTRTFRLDQPPDPAFLPLFAESIRFDRLLRQPDTELARLSLKHLRAHFARRPTTNPIKRFEDRLNADMPTIQSRGLAYYHAWAFGTIRQLGAASELMATYLAWLAENQRLELTAAITSFQTLSAMNKALILKGARAVNAKRNLDPAAFAGMSDCWDTAMTSLANLLDR